MVKFSQDGNLLTTTRRNWLQVALDDAHRHKVLVHGTSKGLQVHRRERDVFSVRTMQGRQPDKVDHILLGVHASRSNFKLKAACLAY